LGSGRYQVLSLLGEGARKRVYLARDGRLDREVAVALIKSDGLDDAGRTRVRREAQAMGSLGDHPNIVTVHDIAEDGDQLYIVSQYMAGGDVESLLRGAEAHRLPLDEVLRLGEQVCRALEHAHARGIIHRDLKPGNVWLMPDGTAKLGDFGLAVVLDRSRITQEGTMVGTALYLPPEQALGRPPDPRSDLYALGAMLYELVTGRPPFLGDDAVAIISQHINTPPVAPSWHNSEVPKPLERLILQLLEKDPGARPSSASDVRVALAAAATLPAEAPDSTETIEANPLDRLAGGVFVGRDREVQTLRSGLDDSLSGHGRVLTLVGEPGIGKTRTSEELATYARMRGAQVLWGRCYEGEGAPAYWPWVQILRAYVHDREPKKLLSEMGPGAADIAEVVSEVRERLPGLPKPPMLDPEQARFRLFDSITTFLRNASSRTPLVLIVDDLHWADKPSLLLFQFLARELGHLRILLLGTYRDVELGRQHPLEQTLATLARSHLSERVLLRGLTEGDVARFIELTAGRPPPAALVEAVYRETEGNPFFVHEVVRLLQSDGRLEHLDEVDSWSVEIPQGVRQVIGRRLSSLSEDCNRVLTMASVIGREFELPVLSRVADLPADALLERLEEAEDARILTEVEAAAGSYRFSHALIRETLYDELRTTRRVRLHRRVGEVLEALCGDNPEPRLAELAYHFSEAASGGDVDKAIDYAERAAQRSMSLVAYEEAVSHCERALYALEAKEDADEARRCELLVALGGARLSAGAAGEVADTFRQALELARRIEAPTLFARAALGLGLSEWASPSEINEELVQVLEEAVEHLGEEEPGLRSRVLARLATELLWSGDPERRESLIRESLEIARSVGDHDALATAIGAAAWWLPENEEIERRLSLADEIVELASAGGGGQASGVLWPLGSPRLSGRAWRCRGRRSRARGLPAAGRRDPPALPSGQCREVARGARSLAGAAGRGQGARLGGVQLRQSAGPGVGASDLRCLPLLPPAHAGRAGQGRAGPSRRRGEIPGRNGLALSPGLHVCRDRARRGCPTGVRAPRTGGLRPPLGRSELPARSRPAG
jgi:tetratricopeptide (TPR) repeat protein